jgi:DNA mismatch repair protein MutH
MSHTISEINKKFNDIKGKEFTLPISLNKGGVGLMLEELLDIPHTSNCLDCSDGELKAIPLKKLKNGMFVPKETMAVTMLSREDLRSNDFKCSNCYKKMKRMMIVTYYRNGDKILFINSTIIDCIKFADLYKIVESDYNDIKKDYMEHGILRSKTGMLLQNRTKGPGHGSTSRAFYLRKEFITHVISKRKISKVKFIEYK